MDHLAILRRVAPEIIDVIERRYTVLQTIYHLQPIGRRALASRLEWPERMVRKEVEFLRSAGLINSASGGMEVAEGGRRILEGLKEMNRELRGLADLEQELARRLKLRRVIIVPGDSDVDETVKKEIAVATARYLDQTLVDGDVVAVTGGTTLAEAARSLPNTSSPRKVTVVPARGDWAKKWNCRRTQSRRILLKLWGVHTGCSTFRTISAPKRCSPSRKSQKSKKCSS